MEVRCLISQGFRKAKTSKFSMCTVRAIGHGLKIFHYES